MKKSISVFLSAILCCTLAAPAFATEFTPQYSNNGASSIARAEVTQWYYRIYNGQSQKRLWSVTNEKWLTNWMPVYST